MLLVELDHHLNHFIKCWESEFPIENSESAWSLILFNGQSPQLSEGEGIRPPVSYITPGVVPSFIPCTVLRFLLDIGDASQVRIMHNQRVFLFCVDDVQLDEISALVQSCFKSLKGIFGENR